MHLTRLNVALLFTGQGAQWSGMGRALYESEPTFRDAIDACRARLPGGLPWRLPDLLLETSEQRLQHTELAQPALFTFEYALARLWQSWGLQARAALGHSVGEIAAACIAGALSLGDALELVVQRGRLMGELPSGGGMAAVLARREQVEELLRWSGGSLEIAALNAPDSTVVSGLSSELAAFASACRTRGVEVRALSVSHAFHSRLMEPMLPALEAVSRRLEPREPSLDLVSNVTAQPVGAAALGAGYWVEHARSPVRFSDGLRYLCSQGCQVLLEIGPRPVLTQLARRTLEQVPGGSDVSVIASLGTPRKNRSGAELVQLRAAREQLERAGLCGAQPRQRATAEDARHAS